jgi:hypothetical protein
MICPIGTENDIRDILDAWMNLLMFPMAFCIYNPDQIKEYYKTLN